MSIEALENRLNDFDAQIRREALLELVETARSGRVTLPAVKPEANIHFHTFFSFNGEGYSPSRIAWEARKYGLEVAGIVDFDVLDGLEEFISASDLLDQKATVGLETRVFVADYADKVMTSPKEPGVHYFMAQGCYKLPEKGSKPDFVLSTMRRTAKDRNLSVVSRVNSYLRDIVLDYDRDVAPLTPGGNATERHLLLAYDNKAREVFDDDQRVAAFWAGALEIPEDEALALSQDTAAFHEKLRAKLFKYGGVGYVAPESGSFPAVEDVIEMAKGIGSLPTTAWLDGTSEGESDIVANLEMFVSKGVAAINIIPDRNWNIKNPDEKALKVGKLREVMDAARRFDLPVSVGTEMNRKGMRFVDDFSAPELAEYYEDFVRGAQFFYGHTLLARYTDFGYYSEAAQAEFGNRKAVNEFYSTVGARVNPHGPVIRQLQDRAGSLTSGKILEIINRGG